MVRSWSYDSLGGKTGRVVIEGETYLIVDHKPDTSETIDIDFKKRLIKVYDDESWTILPMDSNSQFDQKARLIDHIDKL